MIKKPHKTTRTRQNLIDAFWELYKQSPIQKITIQSITLKAGYNRSTFYEYFSDVYDILEYIEQDLIASIESFTLDQNLNQVPQTGIEITTLINLYEKNSEYFSVLLGEHGDPSFQSKLTRSLKPKLKANILQLGIKDCLELDLILDYNIAAMNGILVSWHTQRSKLSLQQFIYLVSNLSTLGTLKTLQKL